MPKQNAPRNPFTRAEENVLADLRRLRQKVAKEHVPPHGAEATVASRRRYDPVQQAQRESGMTFRDMRGV